MLAVAEDLIKFTKRLEGVGVPTHQAQETSAAVIDLVNSLQAANKPATQEDLQNLKIAMREDLFKVEAKVSALDTKLEARLGGLETKIEAKTSDIIKWMIGQNIAVLLAIFALMHSMAK